jgi:murein DD-endopeptidase MepM/ murein hydrolase activator NlpD
MRCTKASSISCRGHFVRVAHRDGQLFSWYFHLAAIPRAIVPGTPVKAGRVIGLLGDTGVKHSAPHLHFALSVKTSKQSQRYLDPEPLVAIWPLWIPEEGDNGRVSTTNEPGIPVRGPSKKKKKSKQADPESAPAESTPPADSPVAAEP